MSPNHRAEAAAKISVLLGRLTDKNFKHGMCSVFRILNPSADTALHMFMQNDFWTAFVLQRPDLDAECMLSQRVPGCAEEDWNEMCCRIMAGRFEAEWNAPQGSKPECQTAGQSDDVQPSASAQPSGPDAQHFDLSKDDKKTSLDQPVCQPEDNTGTCRHKWDQALSAPSPGQQRSLDALNLQGSELQDSSNQFAVDCRDRSRGETAVGRRIEDLFDAKGGR